jgi:hypothetical protein
MTSKIAEKISEFSRKHKRKKSVFDSHVNKACGFLFQEKQVYP